MPINYLVTADTCFLDTPGGGARVAWELARLMRRAGHEVALLCSSACGNSDSAIEGIRVVRYAYPHNVANAAIRFRLHLRAAREAAGTYLAGTRWDVVHAHMPIGALATFDGVGRGARRLYTFNSPMAEEFLSHGIDASWVSRVSRHLAAPLLSVVEARTVRLSTEVHTLSTFNRFLFESRHPRYKGTVTTLPWWCPPSKALDSQAARRQLGWQPDEKIVITVRRLVRRMGVDTLIDAFQRSSIPSPARLLIAGDGSDAPRLQALAQRSGAAGRRIEFLGSVSEDTLAALYAGADLCVIPTRALEGFGLVVLEASAAGCPVIAADVGALPEVMDPALREWIFPAGNVDALASSLERALNGDGLPTRAEISARVYARFPPDVLQQQYLSFLTRQCSE